MELNESHESSPSSDDPSSRRQHIYGQAKAHFITYSTFDSSVCCTAKPGLSSLHIAIAEIRDNTCAYTEIWDMYILKYEKR